MLVDNYTHQTRYSLPIPPSPNLQTDEAINHTLRFVCLKEQALVWDEVRQLLSNL